MALSKKNPAQLSQVIYIQFLIKEELRTYPKRLERRFSYGLKSQLLDETNCHRAKAEVRFIGGKADISGVNCTKNDNFCTSCEFWERYKHYVDGLDLEDGLQNDMKISLSRVQKKGEPLKGNICRSLGDCIIALEALQTRKKKVCTTNIKDFKPICNYIGVEICELKNT